MVARFLQMSSLYSQPLCDEITFNKNVFTQRDLAEREFIPSLIVHYLKREEGIICPKSNPVPFYQ